MGSTQISQAQAQQQQLQQVEAQLNSSLAGALSAQQQIVQSLKTNAREQDRMEAEVAKVTAAIQHLDAELAQIKARTQATQKQVAGERAELRDIARAIYVQPSSLLLTVAEASNLGDLLTRIMDLESAGARATQIKGRLDHDLGVLAHQRQLRQKGRQEQAQQQARLAATLQQLRHLQSQQEDSASQLQSKIWATRVELTSVKGQSSQLAQRIADLLQAQQDDVIANGMQQVWAQVQLWQQANPDQSIQASPGHSTRYRFIWPEPTGVITQPFGPTSLTLEPPFAGYPHFHTGIDIAAPEGTPILAADDGVVAVTGSSQFGYGNYVVLAHAGGLATLYGHMEQILVKVGQHVSQGQPIGLEGQTGNATGPHCHFELRIGGQPVDPAPYLPPGPPSAYRG